MILLIFRLQFKHLKIGLFRSVTLVKLKNMDTIRLASFKNLNYKKRFNGNLNQEKRGIHFTSKFMTYGKLNYKLI